MLCGRVLQKGIFAEKINRKSSIDRSNGAKKERAKDRSAFLNQLTAERGAEKILNVPPGNC